MAYPKKLVIEESLEMLRKHYRKVRPHLKTRIQMLILIKKEKAFTKQSLANMLGVNPNSIQTWKKKYELDGLTGLLEFKRRKRIGSSVLGWFDTELKQRLNSKTNPFKTFEEIRLYLSKVHRRNYNYSTIYKYMKREYGATLFIYKGNRAIQSKKKRYRKQKLKFTGPLIKFNGHIINK